MNSKNLIVLVAIAGAAVVAAGVALKGGGSSAEAPPAAGKLYPALSEKQGAAVRVNDAATIRVQRASGGYALKKSGDGWVLEDRGGYPAQMERVRKTMNALSSATTIEAKTADPARYTKLGVEDVDAPDSKSVQLTVLDASGAEMVKLVLGKESESSGMQPTGQRYVRRAGDAQSWLAKLDVDLPENATDWLDKEILKITQDRVRAIEIRQPDGETLLVDRASKEQKDFTLHGVPEGKEPTYPTVANSLAGALEYVNLEDVAPASDVDFTTGTGPIARFVTFDGLVVTVTTKDQDGKSYASFDASYEAPPEVAPPAADAPADAAATPATTKSAEEVQAEVAALQARLSKWAFVISSYNRAQYGKKLAEMLKDKAPPPSIANPDAPSAGEAGDGEPMIIPGNLPKEIQDQIKADLESRGEKAVIGPVRTDAESEKPTPQDGKPDDGAAAPKSEAPPQDGR